MLFRFILLFSSFSSLIVSDRILNLVTSKIKIGVSKFISYLKCEASKGERREQIILARKTTRWNGCQIVLQPSKLVDGREYEWIISPCECTIAELPEAIIDWWVLTCNPEQIQSETVVYPPTTTKEIEELAEQLKQLYPTLDDYDTWTRTTWAFCNTIGYADGMLLMKYYWPEKHPGEYNNLNNTPKGRKCGIGTIKKMISDRNNKLSKLELELKQKYNI
jgi:hypothetical protein